MFTSGVKLSDTNKASMSFLFSYNSRKEVLSINSEVVYHSFSSDFPYVEIFLTFSSLLKIATLYLSMINRITFGVNKCFYQTLYIKTGCLVKYYHLEL